MEEDVVHARVGVDLAAELGEEALGCTHLLTPRGGLGVDDVIGPGPPDEPERDQAGRARRLRRGPLALLRLGIDDVLPGEPRARARPLEQSLLVAEEGLVVAVDA